jgi:hypothetical protein
MASPSWNPAVSNELVTWLDMTYPPERTKPGDSMDNIQYIAGRRSLIDRIRELFHLQYGNDERKQANFLDGED